MRDEKTLGRRQRQPPAPQSADVKVNEAMPILEKIRADKNHLYHDKVEKMSFTDLRLVQYKENK